MNSRSILFSVVGLTVSACNDPAFAGAGLDDLGEIAEREATADLEDGMCSRKRVVGRAPANRSDCAPRANWTVTNVLEKGTQYLVDHPVDLPGNAGRYCVYQWNAGGAPTDIQLNGLMSTLEEPSLDCMAIKPMPPPELPQPTPLDDTLAPVLQSLFWDRASAVTLEELESTEDLRRPVRVSFVDTVPFTFTDYFTYPHGEMLKRMVLDLACPGIAPADCAVKAVRILAMPRLSLTSTDYTHGGVGGTLTDSAAALMEAHRRWMLNGKDEGELHIVNLSLGWIDDAFENPGANMIANAESIHTALKHLSCHGEIVVAAAGNGDPLTCSEDAVYPARWQTEPAPTAAQCATLLGVTQANLPVAIPNTTRPLLYAAAGLTLGDELLYSTPDLSVSPLVAIADHAVGGNPENAMIMTGTSVAAAVTTAAAAMAGSYNPGGDGWDAMDAVYDGAVVMPDLDVTLPMPGSHPTVRRVSICGALTEACAAWGSCGFVPTCTSDPYELDLDVLDFDYGGSDWVQAATFSSIDTCVGEGEVICGTETYAMAPDPNAALACGLNFLDPVLAFVKPQPPKPPCPACTLTTAEQRLYFTLSPEFSAALVQNVTVHITDGNNTELSVDLGDPPVDSASTTRLQLPTTAFYTGMVVKKVVVDVKIDGVKEFNDALIKN